MIVALVILGVALALTVFLFLRHIQTLERDWSRERRELLSRIQHPERVPVDPVSYEIPVQAPDEWANVGEIRIGEEYGTDD